MIVICNCKLEMEMTNLVMCYAGGHLEVIDDATKKRRVDRQRK